MWNIAISLEAQILPASSMLASRGSTLAATHWAYSTGGRWGWSSGADYWDAIFHSPISSSIPSSWGICRKIMIPNTNVLNDRWIGSHTLPDSYPFFFLQSQQRWPILWYRKGTFSELQLFFFKYLHNVSSAERTRHMSYHADLWFGNKCIYRTCPVPTS